MKVTHHVFTLLTFMMKFSIIYLLLDLNGKKVRIIFSGHSRKIFEGIKKKTSEFVCFLNKVNFHSNTTVTAVDVWRQTSFKREPALFAKKRCEHLRPHCGGGGSGGKWVKCFFFLNLLQEPKWRLHTSRVYPGVIHYWLDPGFSAEGGWRGSVRGAVTPSALSEEKCTRLLKSEIPSIWAGSGQYCTLISSRSDKMVDSSFHKCTSPPAVPLHVWRKRLRSH